MKKLILVLGILGMMVSCKPKQQLVSTSVDRRAQVAIKGSWTLTSVTFPGSEYFKVNSFEIADAKCFEGSTWEFVSNNDTGKMALAKTGCPSYASDIKWYVTSEQQMVLKFLKDGEKARKVTSGYILSLGNQTLESFQLTDVVQVGNNKAKVIYQFKKNK